MKRKNRVLLVLSVLALTSQNLASFAYADPADSGGFVPVPGAPGNGGGGHNPGHGGGGGTLPSPTPAPTHSAPAPAPSPTHSAPAPTPVPTPTSSATAAPSPTVTPVNTQQAQTDGMNDGIPDGSQEGHERGSRDGQERGKSEGYRNEFDRCQRDARQQAYDAGYTDGYRVGGNDGNNDGITRGRADGQDRGQADGTADGQKRANADAFRDASPLGRAKGIDQADQSNAGTRGYADGLVAGDQQAQQRALEIDYPRGRKDYRQERESEAIQNNDSFSQRPNTVSSALKSGSNARVMSAKGAASTLGTSMQAMQRNNGDRGTPSAAPDYRYSRPRRTYPTPEETNAYQAAYRNGYNQGFTQEYRSIYTAAYENAYRRGGEQGCEEARRRDYRGDYNTGFGQGRQKGYDQAYQLAYNQTFRNAYDSTFPQASASAYQNSYQPDYDRHFEEARAAAYSERFGQIYDEAHEQGRQEKFAQMYPKYAEQQFQRGRADEAKDFTDRPIRLLMAESTETEVNGLMEPGEALRVHVQLRNFAAAAVKGGDIKVKIEAYDDSSAVITQGEATLVRDLRQKSLTDVREALEFRMNESAADQISRFRITAFYQGRKVGSQDISVSTQFQVAVGFAEEPSLKDGISTTLKVRLTNRSQKATAPMLRVSFLANTSKLDVANPEQTVPGLGAGESRVVEFSAIAHTADESITVPLAVSVNSTRRVGLLDRTQEVPIVNDYRVVLNATPASLTQVGIARLYYRVQNTGSRLLYKPLQLKVSIKNTDHPENFVILGPNPQFLMPLQEGESTQFLVPVLVKAASMGGTLELNLMENGKTVVIHQADFKEADFKKTLN